MTHSRHEALRVVAKSQVASFMPRSSPTTVMGVDESLVSEDVESSRVGSTTVTRVWPTARFLGLSRFLCTFEIATGPTKQPPPVR
jgi:hypothetical protein